MNESLTWLLDAVQSVDPLVRTALAMLAIALETSILIGLIVPGDTIVIVTGTAVGSPLEGVVLIVAVIVGALIGESVGFWLGRWLGPKLRYSRFGARVGEHNWTRAELYLRRRGGPAIFLSRFLPVLHSLVPVTVGMSGFSYRRFLAWTTPACILWAAVYVTASALAADTYRDLSDQLHFAGYVFVGLIVLFLGAVFLVRRLLVRAEARHFAHGDDVEAGDVKD